MGSPQGADVARDIDDLIDGRERLLGLAIERPSLRCGREAPSLTDEQREAELCLQVANEPADRRLRRMQPLGRLGDGCGLEHRTEGLQAFEVHRRRSITKRHVKPTFRHWTAYNGRSTVRRRSAPPMDPPTRRQNFMRAASPRKHGRRLSMRLVGREAVFGWTTRQQAVEAINAKLESF